MGLVNLVLARFYVPFPLASLSAKICGPAHHWHREKATGMSRDPTVSSDPTAQMCSLRSLLRVTKAQSTKQDFSHT